MNTINSAIDNAANPDELRFGIIYQGTRRERPKDIDLVSNAKIISMPPAKARGAGYARALAMGLYDGEDYFLQIDSHTIFAKDWDSKVIDQLQKAQSIANNNKIIISAFPPPFEHLSNNKIAIPSKGSELATYPTKQIPSLNIQGEWSATRVDLDGSEGLPEESKTVLGGFIFCPGEIVEEVPYDSDISFFGEELCFAMRAWTRGWDIYSPGEIILYHFYFRGDRPKIWKDSRLREISWKEMEEISKKRQKSVLTGTDLGAFGAGKVRSLSEFEAFVGIDFKEFYNKNGRL